MDFLGPLLGANGIAVQRVDNGITPVLVRCIAWWKEYDDLAIHIVVFEVAFEGGAVHFDVLNGYGFGARDRLRYFGLDLCQYLWQQPGSNDPERGQNTC